MNALAHARVFDLDQFQYQTLVTDCLRKEAANDRSAAKSLAEAAGASPATAKNWLKGNSVPIGLHMSRLRARFPKLDTELAKIEGRIGEFEPEAERKLNELLLYVMRRQAE